MSGGGYRPLEQDEEQASYSDLTYSHSGEDLFLDSTDLHFFADGDGRDPMRSMPSLRLLYLSLIASMGGFLFGYDTGVVSGAIVLIAKDLELSSIMQGIVVAGAVLGAWFGSYIGSYLSDRTGRRPTIIISAIAFTVGALLMGAARNTTMLVFGRVVAGLGVGIASQAIPMYLAEMSPAKKRGAIIVFYNTQITFGQFVATVVNGFLVNTPNNWRWMLGVSGIPSFLQLVLAYAFLVETPRWCVMKSKMDRASHILEKLKGEPGTVELAELAEEASRTHGGLEVTIWDKLTHKPFLKALVLGCSLQLIQQLVGINTVMYFSSTILLKSGIKDDTWAVWLAAPVAFVNFAFSLVSIPIAHKFSRRGVLLGSLAGVAISLALLSISFRTGVPLLSLSAMVLYLACFASGMGPMPWTINSEIYGSHYRSAGTGIATSMNWAANFVVSLTFLSLIDAFRPEGTFLLYAAFAVVGWIYFFLKLPETKGIRLEDVESLFL
eukprot:Clim_evm83s172 gene=Clim_evmTU83s172